MKYTFGLLLTIFLAFGTTDLSAQGKGKGNVKKEMAKAKKEAKEIEKNDWKAYVKEVKAKPNLTEEEKEELLAAKRAEIKEGRKADRIANRGEMKAKRDSIKAIVKAIEDDPNLTEDEKEAKIKEVRDSSKNERDATRANKGRAKGKNKSARESDKVVSGKKVKKAKRALNKGQKERARKGLDRAEAFLEKALKKGSISEDVYNKRLARINDIRKQIEE